MRQIYSQLTNYSLSKFHKDFKLNNDFGEKNANKQLMTEVFESLRSYGCDTDAIWEEIKRLAKDFLESYYPFFMNQKRL